MSEWAEAEAFLAERVNAARGVIQGRVGATMFGKQSAFFDDPAMFADACCSRRAGKSVGIAGWLLEGPLENPDAPSLYFTKTRKEAKRIIWPVMLRMNRVHNLGYTPDATDLVLKLNGEAKVFLGGIDTRDEIDKWRGTGWGRVAGDEAQSLPAHLKEMVDDVLMPSFMDYGGRLRLIGTPAPVPAGYFYDITTDPEWSHHYWTVWDNPHIPEERKRAVLDRVLKTRGVPESHPSIQREWFGRWEWDPEALVFRFDPARNVYDRLPEGYKWRHVIGVDLGFDDSDAVVVLAFSDDRPDVYMVEERVESKQNISALADLLDGMVARYSPVALVMDTGGLGKKIAEELTARRGLPVEAAQKTEKFAHVELLNDAFRTGRLFLPKGSRCGEDALKVEWDRSTPEKLKISDRFHSDALDALLYGFRACLHWLHVPAAPPVPALATAERHAMMERELMERLEREAEAEKREAASWDWEAWG